jgi:ribosomal protein L11 methyltransferase
MTLTRVSIALRDATQADALSNVLGEFEPAPSAVSLFRDESAGNWRLDAYYLEAPDLEVLADAAKPVLGAVPAEFSTEVVPDANWVAISQAALPPVRAGRFVVHGSHDREVVRGRSHAIEIEAGEAFGTAHHASTRGCLLAIDRLARSHHFRHALDLGCGSGILAIAGAKSFPTAAFVATDIDPRAVMVARDNARLNGVGHRIRFGTAAGFHHPLLRGTGRFDLVLANILAEPLIDLASGVRRILSPRGYAVLAGLLDQEAKKVTAAYVAAGFKVHHTLKLGGWTILTMAVRAPG